MVGWCSKLLSLLLISIIAIKATAEQPDLYFKRLSKENGLSHNKVNCILQDQRGFTWIGTDDGLNRYDGNNFFVYKNRPGSSLSVSGNTITDIHEDKQGVLWIASADGGLTRYDYRLAPSQQFRHFKHNPSNKNSIPVNIINAIAEDQYGYLWLATGGAALLRFDKQKENFTTLTGAGSWTIYDLCFDRNGMIWAGKEGGSILKVNPSTLKWETDPKYDNLYASLPHVVVTSLFRDRKDNIWFGSWDKAVYRYNIKTQQEESFTNSINSPYSFGKDEAIAFNEDKNGRIWIGGKYAGLYIFNPQSNVFYNYRYDPAKEGSLSNNKVNCIYVDKSGMIWIGTNKGISLYEASKQKLRQRFLPINKSQEELIIYDFYKAENNELWIGTNKGLFIEKNGSFQRKELKYKGQALAITKFYKTSDGKFYLGTDYTLFHFNPANFSLAPQVNTEKDEVMKKLIESRVVNITEDRLDNRPILWTVPYGHFIAYYDLHLQKWISRKDTVTQILTRFNIKDNLIRKIVKTSDGNIWLANVKRGLLEIDTRTGTSVYYVNDPSDPSSISNNNIYDLKEDRDGNLWISTFGGGLNHFNRKTKKFTHYQSINNLLEGLEMDDKGNIWCISNGGLQKFDIRTKSFTYFDLPDVEKTGGIKGYIYTDHKGKMYVAGDGYYISFLPGELVSIQQQPRVYLTDFRIFNKSHSNLLTSEEIRLKHGQNFFSIHFSAPSYTSSPVQYSYMLEGVDEEWILAGTSTQAPYTNISGGSYRFKVRATTSPGTWSETISTLRINIVPPFWKTWWFFALLALFLFSISYFIYRYRINELLNRQAIRNRIAQDLHDQVGSTLSSISVYSQVAKIYKEKNKPDELQSALEKISSTSGEMITEMGDIVWAISPKNDNMGTIINRMESYAKPLLNAQGIHCSFTYQDDIRSLNLPMETRKNFYLIFKEAINNAVKYAQCRHVIISVYKKYHMLTLKIEDDGRGFDVTYIEQNADRSLAGNGLKNMHSRANKMNGTLAIISQPGMGTIIELKLPTR